MAGQDTGKATTLRERLAQARRSHFVGRFAEIEILKSALIEGEPDFSVLFLIGPGGIGKTSLLAQFGSRAEDAGIPAFTLDARNIDPSPAGFSVALGAAMGLAPGEETAEALASYPRSLVLIDTYELLAPLDAWLREELLPELPAGCVVVVAGRNPPTSGWRTDPGWSRLVRVVALRNLRPEESRDYLKRGGVPEPAHEGALEFTHGHPLALSMVADLVAQEGREDFVPEREPDQVRILLERFVEGVPSAEHRMALQLAAHARATTEASLAFVVSAERAAELFDWLRGLSFIQEGPDGLFPHDLARDLLDLEYRWRNPDGYRELHARLRKHVIQRWQVASGSIQQRVFFDLLYLHRHSPLFKPFHDWKAMGTAFAEPATSADHDEILDMVRKHEGEEPARIAGYWLKRQPWAFTIFRAGQGRTMGFVAILDVHLIGEADADADPGVRAIVGFVERHGGLRPGEGVAYNRYFMGVDSYQDDPSLMNLVATTSSLRWLNDSRIAWSFVATAETERFVPMFTYISFQRAPAADFEVEGRKYGIFSHDWRVEPQSAWLDTMAERELATDLQLEALQARGEAQVVVLSQPDFQEAVRQALRDFTRPMALGANPLLRSRLVYGGREPADVRLKALFREAAESLRVNPKDERLYHAVHRTYLEPAPTQERAAEALDLPFSTYRRYLALGIERVSDWLWQRELYGEQA